MIPLAAPTGTPDDDAYLVTICQQNAWATPHQPPWLGAYAHYRTHLGNPWNVAPTVFSPDVGEKQYALYDTRRSGKRIQEIRDTPGLLCCPMCGSGMTGTLDHFLPRDKFPEFSVMLANLIPACSQCNSSGKRQVYRGDNPESFIHPYFETLAISAIWQIEVLPPFGAATFRAFASNILPAPQKARVSFHLGKLLGKQFHLWAANRWSTLPQVIRNGLSGTGPITANQVQVELTNQLGQHNVATGLNSWQSAFFRGLLNDAGAHAHIAALATPLTATPPA
jgi:5-methylcytosine-specific restriction endonuclease McrA